VDGCHTRLLTPFGQHKEDYTNKNATSSLLLLAITDTSRIRYLVGGFPGSCGDSTALKGRSWYKAMLLEDATLRPLSANEFILGDAGFGLTPFLVCSVSVSTHTRGITAFYPRRENRRGGRMRGARTTEMRAFRAGRWGGLLRNVSRPVPNAMPS